jgi:hypothetical protein
MSLKLACPRCHHVQFFDDAFAGEAVTCGKCAQAFRVPRAAEPAVAAAPATAAAEAPAPVAVAPWPASTKIREVPTTFAPSEPLAVKVVELPDAPDGERRPAPARVGDDPFRLQRPSMSRSRLDEPGKLPWTFGVSSIAFLLLLFGATAAWFMMRDHRPPPLPQKAFVPAPFPQPGIQPPMQPQLPPPALAGQDDARHLKKGKKDPVLVHPNELVNELKLVQGRVRVQGMITANDPAEPFHPFPGCHRKIYSVELKAGRRYTIEMLMDPPRMGPINRQGANENNGQGRELDAYLIIEDKDGNVLDWNDDIVPTINLNSRINPPFEPPVNGVYRIIATSFWANQTGGFVLEVRDEAVGKPVVTKKLPNRKLPTPIDGQALEVVQDKQPNILCTTILKNETQFVGDVCWSADGTAFFALDAQGTLRRIAWPGNVEERRLATNLPAASLALSKAGLLVSFPSAEEVWVVDPATLEVKTRMSAPGVQRVSATPAADVAFAAVTLKRAPQPPQPPRAPQPPKNMIDPQPVDAGKAAPTEGIMVLNAATAKAVRVYDQYSPKHLTVTPDGNYLFIEGNIERLLRYRIQGDELMFEEDSPRLAGNGQGIFVSPDSKYVCLTSPGGNYATDPMAPVKQYTTLIFKTTDLKNAAFAIWTGESPRVVGFDPTSATVVSHNNDKQIMLFSETGVRTQEENLPGDRLAVTPRQFLPHPAGGRMLVRTENAIFGVEFAKEEK